MRPGLRKALPVLAVAGVLVGFAGPANASNTMHGGCWLYLAPDPSFPGLYDVVMGESSTTQDGNGAPVSAIVECDLLIDGVETPSTYLTASGTGSQSGTLYSAFSASSPSPVIQLCQRVSYDERPSD